MKSDHSEACDAAIKARMRERMAELRWTLEELAEKTDESYSNIRNWVTGTTRVPAAFLARYAEVVPVNPTWLLTGQGPAAPLEDGTPELMFQLFTSVSTMADDADLPRGRFRELLEDVILLLQTAESD